MELATEQRPPIGLRLARHAVGMCIVALANPLIYFDASPFEQWAMLPVGAVAIAGALFGVLALISPERAKAAWPATPIKSAWFILALMLFSNWQGYRSQPTTAPVQNHAEQQSPYPGLKPFNGKLDGE